MTDNKEQRDALIQSRFKSLFGFLKAYNDLRTPVISDIANQIEMMWLNSVPKHPSIIVHEYITNLKDQNEEGATGNEILLEVTRPEMTPCPKPPEILSGWVVPGWTKLDKKAEVLKSRNILSEKNETEIVKFDDSDERKESFSLWNKKRKQWIENEKLTWDAIKFFERMYEFYGHMEREGERVELLIGDGLLECSSDNGIKISHPVLLQRLELEFKPGKKQPQFVISRKEQQPELYMDFLRSLPDVDTQQVVQCVDELRSSGYDPLGQDDTSGFLRRIIQGLFPGGGQFVESGDQKNPDSITIERNPVIFMRQRHAGLGQAIDNLLQDVAKRIEEGQPFSIALLQILGIDKVKVPLSEEQNETTTFGNEDSEILLSKAANKEQLQIAKQLKRRGTVLVQGPPGTGKSHSIANLVGHLLSEGKRVLVTAQSPKALKVLREQIVPEVQSLCVSVLHKEKENIEELHKSVRVISEKLSRPEKPLEKEVKQIREERNVILEELKNFRQQLFDAREDEIREVVFGGNGIRPIDAAKIVYNNMEKDNWIPGPVILGVGLPITSEECAVLYRTNTISASVGQELDSKRPDLSTLPSAQNFEKIIKELSNIEKEDIFYGAEYWNEEIESLNREKLENLIDSSSKASAFLEDSPPWQMEIVQAGRDGDVSKKTWINFADFIEKTWSEIQELNSLIMQYGPVVGDKRPSHELLAIINEIVAYVDNGQNLGLLQKVINRSWFQFLDTVQISGRQIDYKNKDHLLALQALLKVADLRQELSQRWERSMTHGGAPKVSDLGDKPEQVCRQFVSLIKEALEWHVSIWTPLELDFNQLGFKWSNYLDSTKPLTGENAQLRRLRSAVMGDLGKILQSKLLLQRKSEIDLSISNWKKVLSKESKNDSKATRLLRQALSDNDYTGYTKAHSELVDLARVEEEWNLRRTMIDKISKCAPSWASALELRQGVHLETSVPGDVEAAWKWRQLHDELEKRSLVSLEELQVRIEDLNKQLFDVVIIDEASQSDPLTMFALYLGEQAVVVGDDEQVTPTTSGLQSDEIIKLIKTYLHDVPHQEFYDGQTSIYAFAQTVFGDIIRLTEHFRCAPDIIAFSNALSYDGEIKPLKEENSISLHPSVIPYRVSGVCDDNKTNTVEADTITALICSAIEQSEYKDKTFGVVTLRGDRQAEEIQKKLLSKISSEIYQRRRILCGSPAHFQGDERDVMFLSMVDSPTGGPLNLQDGDANRKLFRKRYNVAASRAKDQMWLVYSLNHENDLKSGDIRKRLIEHMHDPKAWRRELDALISKADSPFEEKVIARLLQRDFKIQPQYPVGAYRIDMVVTGDGKQVAIECDGERWHGPDKLKEDMDRQAILERLGWKFIRIRGSLFFRDPDRAMDIVFSKLAEMGILPERKGSKVENEEETKTDIIDRVRIHAEELQREWEEELINE